RHTADDARNIGHEGMLRHLGRTVGEGENGCCHGDAYAGETTLTTARSRGGEGWVTLAFAYLRYLSRSVASSTSSPLRLLSEDFMSKAQTVPTTAVDPTVAAAAAQFLSPVVLGLEALTVNGKQAHWHVRGANFVGVNELLDTVVANAGGFADTA